MSNKELEEMMECELIKNTKDGKIDPLYRLIIKIIVIILPIIKMYIREGENEK